jgi:hypothetical protein
MSSRLCTEQTVAWRHVKNVSACSIQHSVSGEGRAGKRKRKIYVEGERKSSSGMWAAWAKNYNEKNGGKPAGEKTMKNMAV